MADPNLLADVNKWVGVTIALVGSVVVAPEGTRLLLGSSWVWLRRQSNRARRPLSRVLPFLRRNVKVHLGTAVEGSAAMGIAATLKASGRAWIPTAPIDERIDALRRHITEVEGRLNGLTQQLRQETSNREGAIAELDRTLKSEATELRRLLEEKDRETARIDARGLPVIGFGILLSGVPEALSLIPWHLGWLLPLAGVGLTVPVVVQALREHRQSRTQRVVATER